MSNHESLQSYRSVVSGSNRTFGIAFAGAFLFLAFWPLVRHGDAPRWWALAPALFFAGLALAAPERLTPLNQLWFRLGLATHRIVSPVIMGLLFYVAVTPTGLLMRAMGKDLLSLRRHDGATYWRHRDPPGPPAGSMKNQF